MIAIWADPDRGDRTGQAGRRREEHRSADPAQTVNQGHGDDATPSDLLAVGGVRVLHLRRVSADPGGGGPAPIARRPGSPCTPHVPVSVVIAAYNEEARIGLSVRELVRLVAGSAGRRGVDRGLRRVNRPNGRGGSSGRDRSRIRDRGMDPIRVIALPTNLGKAAALNAGWAAASHPLLVFADARQTWAPDAIERITENFADPSVGAVSGDLVVESPTGVMAGFGLYWRFEKWLRRTESRFDSLVSVTGSICAVRRELFRPIPNGTILDDVYWPLLVAMGGYRVDSRRAGPCLRPAAGPSP